MTSRATAPRPLRLAASLGAGLLAATALTACAAGNDAETAEEHATIDGTIVHAGPLDLDGLSLAAPSGPAYPPGSDVVVHLVVINDGDHADALVGVRASAFRGWRVSEGPAPTVATARAGRTSPEAVSLPAGSSVGFDEPDTRRTLTLVGLERRLYAGNQIRVSFIFRRAGTVHAWVPVQLSPSRSAAMAAS
jgi:copper(I)-binding protein